MELSVFTGGASSSSENNTTDIEQGGIAPVSDLDCAICLAGSDTLTSPLCETACKHHFCQDCLGAYAIKRPAGAVPCPLCRAALGAEDIPSSLIVTLTKAAESGNLGLTVGSSARGGYIGEGGLPPAAAPRSPRRTRLGRGRCRPARGHEGAGGRGLRRPERRRRACAARAPPGRAGRAARRPAPPDAGGRRRRRPRGRRAALCVPPRARRRVQRHQPVRVPPRLLLLLQHHRPAVGARVPQGPLGVHPHRLGPLVLLHHPRGRRLALE